ncbi:hypothetical protein GXY_06103 [Novacetimonas hansenii ATCC 23769]|uniref:Uncharacterized protein n=1 Tax=Novacetimonas hansenii ATCC 23769 TaxID=714995 RepID=D5QDL0_NOVHA|nr:hypothetical protein GXY_06103 [Novacetimonas hansenii ATCC 23769]
MVEIEVVESLYNFRILQICLNHLARRQLRRIDIGKMSISGRWIIIRRINHDLTGKMISRQRLVSTKRYSSDYQIARIGCFFGRGCTCFGAEFRDKTS